MDGSSIAAVSIENLITLLYGSIGGALVTVVALRTQLAMMKRDIRDLRRHQVEVEERTLDRLRALDRRSVHGLKIMADVARKVGVDSRFSDSVLRMLAEERGATEQDQRQFDSQPDDN